MTMSYILGHTSPFRLKRAIVVDDIHMVRQAFIQESKALWMHCQILMFSSPSWTRTSRAEVRIDLSSNKYTASFITKFSSELRHFITFTALLVWGTYFKMLRIASKESIGWGWSFWEPIEEERVWYAILHVVFLRYSFLLLKIELGTFKLLIFPSSRRVIL